MIAIDRRHFHRNGTHLEGSGPRTADLSQESEQTGHSGRRKGQRGKAGAILAEGLRRTLGGNVRCCYLPLPLGRIRIDRNGSNPPCVSRPYPSLNSFPGAEPQWQSPKKERSPRRRRQRSWWRWRLPKSGPSSKGGERQQLFVVGRICNPSVVSGTDYKSVLQRLHAIGDYRAQSHALVLRTSRSVGDGHAGDGSWGFVLRGDRRASRE